MINNTCFSHLIDSKGCVQISKRYHIRMKVLLATLIRLFPRYDEEHPFKIVEPPLSGSEIFAHSLIRGIKANVETSPFRVLKQIVLSSLFAHAEVRDEVVSAFGTGIRFHRAFCRLARRCKVAKARTAGTDTDLMGTPLDELPPSVVFRMYDEPTSCNYEFRISDLLRIITTSLCNSPGLFAEPMRPRNPYTNIELSDAQLYNLYFSLIGSPIGIPLIFREFVKRDLSLMRFQEDMEPVIRDMALRALARNASTEDRLEFIRDLLSHHRDELGYSIPDAGFPKDVLLNAFGGCIPNYLQKRYSLCPTKRHACGRRLRQFLRRFYSMNPTFGRKIFKLVGTLSGNPSRARRARETYITEFQDPDGALPFFQTSRSPTRRRPRRSIGRRHPRVHDINPFEGVPFSFPPFAALDQPTVARIEEVPATPVPSGVEMPDVPSQASDNSSQDDALFEVHRVEDEGDTLLRDPSDLLRALDISSASAIVDAVESLVTDQFPSGEVPYNDYSSSDDDSMGTFDS